MLFSFHRLSSKYYDLIFVLYHPAFSKIFALTSNLVSTYSLEKKQNTLYTLNFKCSNLCVEHFRSYLCYNLQFHFRFKKR